MKQVISLKKAAGLVLALVLAASSSLFAQEARKDKMSPIMSKKVEFITTRLQLTPEEASTFWPLYNTLSKAHWNACRESMRIINQLKEATKEESSVSDEEIKEMTRQLYQSKKNEIEVYDNLVKEVSKVLPMKKAAKIYWIEEDFRKELIKELRKGGRKPNHDAGGQPKEKPEQN